MEIDALCVKYSHGCNKCSETCARPTTIIIEPFLITGKTRDVCGKRRSGYRHPAASATWKRIITRVEKSPLWRHTLVIWFMLYYPTLRLRLPYIIISYWPLCKLDPVSPHNFDLSTSYLLTLTSPEGYFPPVGKSACVSFCAPNREEIYTRKGVWEWGREVGRETR